MNIVRQTFIIFLCATLSLTSIHCQETQTTQSVIIKKLKKAWQNNWVKAGIVTTACALIYALGINLNAISPSAICTGTPNCPTCTKAPAIGPSYKLFWKALGIISGLIACGFGYKYYTSQNDQENQPDDAANNKVENNSAAIEFNDDFFDFPDDELNVETPVATTVVTSTETPSTLHINDTKVEPTETTPSINELVTQEDTDNDFFEISDDQLDVEEPVETTAVTFTEVPSISEINNTTETFINNEELSFI